MIGRRGGGPEVRETGGASTGAGGTANTGYVHGNITTDNRTVHVHTGRRPSPWPCRIGVIPREARAYQERAETAQLRDATDAGGTAVLCQVLRGTGGVGKTQLAAHHAEELWSAGELDVLLWVTASDRSAVIAAYARAAEELLAVPPGNPDHAAETLLQWLASGESGCRWLVVLDDVSDPADVRGLWPPESPLGRTVITTRRMDTALPGRRVDLGQFTPEQSLAYLTTFLAAHDRHDPGERITALASDLGHLPLALAQAAAYILDEAVPVDEYRARLARATTRLTDLLPEEGALPDDQTTTVAATWSLSVAKADTLRPVGLALPVLRLTSMLDPNGIPEWLLTGDSALEYLGAHVARQVSPEEARGALRLLHRFGLLGHDPETGTVRVHQLTQRATRDALGPLFADTARTAGGMLTTAWSNRPDVDSARACNANAAVLTVVAGEALYTPRAHRVLFELGTKFDEHGQVDSARQYFAGLVASLLARLGPDHHDTLRARSRLVHARGRAGEVSASIQASVELLHDQTRVLGPLHSSTLIARVNLARLQGHAGQAVTAVAELRAVLPDLTRVLGPRHRRTLDARAALGHCLGQARRYPEAVATLRELVVDQIEVLGRTHATTLDTRSSIAIWQSHAGDSAAAIRALHAVLPDLTDALGPTHPFTFRCRGLLGHVLTRAGDHDGALAELASLLPDRIRVLGPDHPDTFNTRRHLAKIRGRSGDPIGAVEEFESLARDASRALGPEHLYALGARRHAAWWRGQAGDTGGALAAFEELLPDLVRRLGPDHHHAVNARVDLGELRRRISASD
ncbi:FxSxx-COOH system tetratricopeptide repeat protein [Streptomyces sp. BI20]|uniref:FxSxx-COOH system tetratricopeptide repeat protein n=1 Tax=Streptomyces sp. BI20 TaxID=3403460 RepID=UPI003C77913F